MITVEFPARTKRYGGKTRSRTVRAIIIDEPFNGVSGIVECCNCEWRAVITAMDIEGQAQEIEAFANDHLCQRLPTKQDLLDAILKRHSSDKSKGGLNDKRNKGMALVTYLVPFQVTYIIGWLFRMPDRPT